MTGKGNTMSSERVKELMGRQSGNTETTSEIYLSYEQVEKLFEENPEYDEFGAIVSTTVTLASQHDGYATFTETLSADHTRKTNDELITLAKNQYFKKEYTDYAMQDAVIKVDELERSIKSSEVLQASLQTLITETKLQSSKNAEDLIAAENSRNAVFENIITTVNGHEQRLTNLISTTNSFMEEVFAMLTPEAVLNDVKKDWRNK